MTEIKIDDMTFNIYHWNSEYSSSVRITISRPGREMTSFYMKREDFKVLADFLKSVSKNKIQK